MSGGGRDERDEAWVEYNPELDSILREGRRPGSRRGDAAPSPLQRGLKVYVAASLVMASSLLAAGRILESGLVAVVSLATYIVGRWRLRWVS